MKHQEITGHSEAGTNPAKLPKRADPSHFAYIDAVRGFAFLAVLVMHAAFVIGPFYGRSVLVQAFYGVQLFFLASAITLCHSMAERQKVDRFPVFYFYLRRFFRIAPLFWLAMIFYWTCPQSMPAKWYSEWVASDGVHPSYFVLTTLFLHGWHPLTFNCIVPGGWSIDVEMNFYLFFPLLFCLVNSLKKAAVFFLCSLLYTNLIYHFLFPNLRQHLYPGVPDMIWGFYRTHCFFSQIVVFLIGFLAYHLLQNEYVTKLRKSRFWAVCLFCVSGVFLVAFLHDGSIGLIPVYIPIVLALAAIIISISGNAVPWMVNPVICYIGRISYSCYLVHFGVLYTTFKLLGIPVSMNFPLYDSGHSLNNLWFFVKVVVLTLIFTAIISTITLHLIENPGIALGKKIIRRINARMGGK